MPSWAGKWKGGRYYLDEFRRPVFYIERRGRVRRLHTHDPDLALGELARFLDDPDAYCRPPPEPAPLAQAVHITTERLQLYLDSIHDTVKDHRAARASYLADWSDLRLDLRTVDRRGLRAALATFTGGHAGRVEALNAFARFLVREGDLPAWNPLVNTREPKETRAERTAYSLEELAEVYGRLAEQPLRDLFHVRVATGLHHTEIEQLKGCRVVTTPLPDRGVAIRKLDETHEIRGVIQIRQKTKPRHRVSVTADTLGAALRLREGVPHRIAAWKAFDPIVPSNLRHTFTTLAGEVGVMVSRTGVGVGLDEIAQILGHRVGSKMTAARYDKLQIPAMVRLPIPWAVL